MNKGKVMHIILNALIVIVACILLFCVYKLYTIWRGYNENQKTQDQVQKLFYGNAEADTQQVSGSETGEDSNEKEQSIAKLDPVIAANEDTVGWIKVEDTVIDYVVVQGEDNDEYLHKGFYGEYNSAGTIFLDYRNEIGGKRQNYVVYGHRMKDDSMFGELGEYLDYGFYQQHPTFTFITADAEYDCEIFAIYRCTTEVDYCQPTFASDEDMLDYVKDCKNLSEHKMAVEVTADDTIITLSTCDYALDPDLGRLVVHAKLIEKE